MTVLRTNTFQHINSKLALELVMRDSLGGLEEMMLSAHYTTKYADLHIIDVKPEKQLHIVGADRQKKQAIS